jgi:RNA polymerase sigma-70 factor, ECF subfamily
MRDMSSRDPKAPRRPVPPPDAAATAEEGAADDLDRLLVLVARGDERAFEAVYDRLAGPAYGVARRVVRDPAQSEEVAQEALLEVWRTAARFDPAVGSAATWVMTIVHRRANARVRSMAATLEREQKTASPWVAADEVADAVEARLDRERVRRCLDGLTEVQHESITLAYYGGYSYREVAKLLGTAVGTIKTRIRDGLIRLRDCLGVG